MSSFQRDLMKSKLSKMNQLENSSPSSSILNQQIISEEEQEELENSFGSMLPPTKANSLPAKSRRNPSRDYSPLSASSYFSVALEVEIEASGSSLAKPTVFRVYYTPPSKPPGVVFVFHHGAGYSGLSFATLGKEILEREEQGEKEGAGNVGFLAFDARGHGKTTSEEEIPDLSIGNLVNDLVLLLKKLFPNPSDCPKFILVGHSMGGAVVAHSCSRIQKEVGKVTGLVMLDIVEGSAVEALGGMMGLINSRPKGFDSVEQAIEWHIRSLTIRNLTSARISVASLLERNNSPPSRLTNPNDFLSLAPPSVAPWATEAFEEFQNKEKAINEEIELQKPWRWRTDLSKTEPYWLGWFQGLSKTFLEQKTAKMLILAGTDRLDKELTIGQMQGKYQLEIMQDVGHCLHEDDPKRTARTLFEFWKRNDQEDFLKNIKKVGQS